MCIAAVCSAYERIDILSRIICIVGCLSASRECTEQANNIDEVMFHNNKDNTFCPAILTGRKV